MNSDSDSENDVVIPEDASNNDSDSDNQAFVYSWGSTIDGQLGVGGIEDHHLFLPTRTKFHPTNIKQVGCGERHTLVLTTDGKVYSCGNNDSSQLGHQKSRTKLNEVCGLAAHHIVQVACGSFHSIAVNEWGQVFTWGCNSSGQLGIGLSTDTMQPVPKIVKTLATQHVVQICCGSKHCLALTNNGALYSWGSNDSGQCGLWVPPVLPEPTVVTYLEGLPISFIACGWYHSFAVSKSGAIYGWGKNNFGQLGLDSCGNQPQPKHLNTMRSVKVKYIACGEDFSVFLTEDGGVFSCGAGMYGQLGHGTTANEVLPKKVMELMGSTVTQIACGRRHTLALIPSRSRIYAFGLGSAGQLGNRVEKVCSTPKVVLGPWLPGHTEPDSGGDFNPKYVVKRIYSGGDQCFVTICKKTDNALSDDYRHHSPETQIWAIEEQSLARCEHISPSQSVDQDLLRYLEVVMSSVACVNGSFLRKDGSHFFCNPKNHGIDLDEATRCFNRIGRIENPSILSTIISSMVALVESINRFPDMEMRRVFLIAPLYHEFLNPKNSMELQLPFADRLLKYATDIDEWYKLVSSDYFEHLILIFKNVFADKLKNLRPPYHIDVEPGLIIPLEMLAKLNDVNRKCTSDRDQNGGFKVPCNVFYISEINDHINIQEDYAHWVTTPPAAQKKKRLCDYPFVFDPEAKTMILQVDQIMQMHHAMNTAMTSTAFGMFLSPTASINQFLFLRVSRENIVQDTIRELNAYSASDLKKPLRIRFLDEEAEDAGGVRKEFFLLVFRNILDPQYGMFKYYEESRTIWFREDSFEENYMFFLIGLLCGLAIYNFTIIDLPFPLVLYKKLLDEPVSLRDVKELSPLIYRSLVDLLDYKEEDFEVVYDLRFEVTKDLFGEIKTVPLKPNGENIPVTQHNKYEFVQLYVDMLLSKSVEMQFNAFKDGFFQVCGTRVLKLFQSQELMTVVVGNEEYDWYQLENNAEYKNGYTSGDPTVRLFWEVFHELSVEEKKKFLRYLTGSDRIPIQGMKAIKIIIQPTEDDRYLPVAHTCFNLLDLPRYRTKERLRYKLLQAIQQTHGFSLV